MKLVDELEIGVDEARNFFQRESLNKRGILCTSTIDGSSIAEKLRFEARRRLLKHEMDMLPDDEQIEVFIRNLFKATPSVSVEAGKLVNYLIDYLHYKATLFSAPQSIRCFISAKTFIQLSKMNSDELHGMVSIHLLDEYIRNKRDRLLRIISLHYYDSTGKGYLSYENLSLYLTEEVFPRLPSMSGIENTDPFFDYYVCISVQKFIFFLDPSRQNRIRIIDVVASQFLEQIEMLNELASCTNMFNDETEYCSSTSKFSNWFSKENCNIISKLYQDLDEDRNGLLSFSELKCYKNLTESFVKRIFEVTQTYDHDEIDLRAFCDLLLAMENKSDKAALNYYFRILDVDGDGFLGFSDLYLFYRDLATKIVSYFPDDDCQGVPPFQDLFNEIRDMCRSRDPRGITLKDLISSGNGGTVVGMITDVDSFIEYENREDKSSEQNLL